MKQQPINIGIVGTGYVSSHFYRGWQGKQGINVAKVLTRRPIANCTDFPNQTILTNAIDDLLENCDVVYECSGDPIYAADIVDASFKANKPVVTTNAEFHVTCGSYYVDKGLLTESDGDQPGAMAVLNELALERGFKPLAYLNPKGFLDKNPKLKDMEYWANHNGISIPSVTSFTDGTKIQYEQALVANGCGATFYQEEMLGLQESDLDVVKNTFGAKAKELGQAISDYIIYPGAPHAVFIVAEHQEDMQPMLRYVKMGDGPFYLLRQDSILIHMDVPRTIRRLLHDKKPLINNSKNPSITVMAVAKKALAKDHVFEQAIGGFDLRGVGAHIKDHPNAVPMGLLQNVRLRQNIEAGQIITFDDVELPESLALDAWHWTLNHVLANETVSA